MSDNTTETATAFFLKKRGRTRAKWIVAPVTLLLLISVGVAVGGGRSHRPELVPYTLGLYGCTAFFVHAYVIAWRAGSFVWQYGSLLIALTFYAVLSILHADDAAAWVIWSESGAQPRPPRPELFVSITLNIISGVLLTLHAFFLGLGSRQPTPTEMNRIVKSNASGIMSTSTFEDEDALEAIVSAFSQLEDPDPLNEDKAELTLDEKEAAQSDETTEVNMDAIPVKSRAEESASDSDTRSNSEPSIEAGPDSSASVTATVDEEWPSAASSATDRAETPEESK